MTSFEAFTEICCYLLGKDFCITDPVNCDTARDILVEEIKKRYPAADESPVDKWRRKHKRCIWCIYCVPDQVFDPNSQVFETRYKCAAKCIKRIDCNMPRPFCTLFNLKRRIFKMIKIENVEVTGWQAAIRGMRNPMNSWAKSDSDYRPILCSRCDSCETFELETWEDCDDCEVTKYLDNSPNGFLVGPNDHDLMMGLRNSGTDHRKFMRMIAVYLDITAPLYWWKEFDTYKVGTVANSCSTMHKIAAKEFTLDDFSTEHLYADDDIDGMYYSTTAEEEFTSTDVLKVVIEALNNYRKQYLIAKDKNYWWQMIQLLPSSYNQRRTVMLNYEVLANMYKSRKDHKLDEWREFCKWIETLPYSELITGEKNESENI